MLPTITELQAGGSERTTDPTTTAVPTAAVVTAGARATGW
jgi:hypothetical protein